MGVQDREWYHEHYREREGIKPPPARRPRKPLPLFATLFLWAVALLAALAIAKRALQVAGVWG